MTRTTTSETTTGLETCPYCGQALLDRAAISRVRESAQEAERKLAAAAKAEGARLAKAATAKMEAKLAEERSKHAEAMRKLRVDVRAAAETKAKREAEGKVRSDLGAKDRAIAAFKAQLDVQARQIEHLTSDERGEMNELELLGALKAAFPDDQIERVGRGRAGGDILHEVRVNNGAGTQTAGRIVYECKDTLAWGSTFLDQARKEGVTHHTRYVVIVTRAFPRDEKMLAVREGIVIVHPSRMVDLARIMRRMVEEVHRAGLTADGQAAKTAELYTYLSSPEFRQSFDAIGDVSATLIGLLGKERKWHEQTWSRRQAIYDELNGKTASIGTRIRTILEKQPDMDAKVLPLPGARRPVRARKQVS